MEIGLLRYDGMGGITEDNFVDSLGCKEFVFEAIQRIGQETKRNICNKCVMEGRKEP
jgi:hypothetical protein